MKRNLLIAISLLTLLISGCASVPMAPMDEDVKAKTFSTLPEKASLYIYRHESFGGAIPMSLSVNGKSIGQTAAKTYFRLNLAPGKYSVESHAENVSNLSLNMEAGSNYFVWQEVKMGVWMARSLLQQTDEKTGRAAVMKSKLIATTIAETELSPFDKSLESSTSQKLRDLQGLRNDNIITEEEFQKKKGELLDDL